MSTYWGYTCKTHDPAIESEHWFNHGQGILRDIWTKRDDIVAWEQASAGIWWLNGPTVNDMHGPVEWIREHQHCDVWLRNEYGDEEDLRDPEAEAGDETLVDVLTEVFVRLERLEQATGIKTTATDEETR